MMGWLLVILLAVLVVALLWRFGKLDRQPLEIIAAGLLLAVAGYAWLGSPSMPGSPSGSTAPEMRDVAPESYRITDAGGAAKLLHSIDALIQTRQTRDAVERVQAAIAKDPKNPDLWVGLGQALFAHGGNQMNAAAEIAFHRAAEIAPNHPGPPFFYGFALAQAGKYDEAGTVWRALLARAPANSDLKTDLEARLADINQLTADPAKPSAQTAN